MNKNVIIRNGKIMLSGLIIGIINGLIGGFAGIISIIILKRLYFMNQKKAQATTLSYIWIVSLLTTSVYIKQIKTNFSMCLWLIIGGIVGTVIGTKILNKMKEEMLKIIFGIIMIITGIVVIAC